MKRILFVLAVLLAVVSIGCVSAADNATDVIADDSADVLSQDADDEGLSQTHDEVGNALEAESDSSVLQDEEKASSEITSSNVKGYESFKSEVSFKLTSNDVSLANRSVSIMINDATYDRVTDSEGIAKLTFSLKAGTYIATCTYDGDNTTQEGCHQRAYKNQIEGGRQVYCLSSGFKMPVLCKAGRFQRQGHQGPVGDIQDRKQNLQGKDHKIR